MNGLLFMDSKCRNERNNRFLDTYIKEFIEPFREHNKDIFEIVISGLGAFITEKDGSVNELLNKLKMNGFIIIFNEPETTITSLHIAYKNVTNHTCENNDFRIQNLPSLIEISSRANISIYGIIVMKVSIRRNAYCSLARAGLPLQKIEVYDDKGRDSCNRSGMRGAAHQPTGVSGKTRNSQTSVLQVETQVS